MKKIITGLLIGSIIIIGSITLYLNHNKLHQSGKAQKTMNVDGSITQIQSLSELKNQSDTIVEVVGTNEHKTIDYKGIPAIISTLKVNEVYKGDKTLKEIKILQVKNLDVLPENGQKLLMFLRKDRDNLPDKPYAVVGAGQGIYILSSNFSAKAINESLTSNSNNITVEPQAIKNDKILKDLSGNYNDIKNKLKN